MFSLSHKDYHSCIIHVFSQFWVRFNNWFSLLYLWYCSSWIMLLTWWTSPSSTVKHNWLCTCQGSSTARVLELRNVLQADKDIWSEQSWIWCVYNLWILLQKKIYMLSNHWFELLFLRIIFLKFLTIFFKLY